MTTQQMSGTPGSLGAPAKVWRAALAVALLVLTCFAGVAHADDFSLPEAQPKQETPQPAPAPSTAASPGNAGGMTITLPPGGSAAPAPAPAAAPATAAAPAPAPAAPADAAGGSVVAPVATPTQATVDNGTPPDAQAATADQAFDDRTKALEGDVNNLRVDVKNTYLRLVAMSEQILGGEGTSGAKLSLWHRNELGSSYLLVGAVYALDGAPLYTKSDDSGDLSGRDEFVIFESRVVPGPHQLAVQYELRGHGYGIFQYLEGMHLTLRKSLSFNAEPGKVTKITGTVYERGEITLQFKDKPDVNFDETVTKETVKQAAETDEQGGAVPAVAPGSSSGAGK